MVKIILLAILCALTFVSCRENKKNVSDADVKTPTHGLLPRAT